MIKKYRTNQALINSGFNQPAGTGFTLTLSGNTIIANSGTFQYSTNRSAYFNITPRAVPDVAYVTGLTANIHNIGTVGQIIYRDISGITGATNFTYNKLSGGTVTVPNLHISQSPAIQAGNYFLLTWDSGTTKVNKIPALSVTGIQGAINGLSVFGDCVTLGGVLICNTSIVGSGYSFCVNNANNPIVIDNRCNGGIYLKSQCGTSSSYFDDFTNSVGISINKCNNGFKIYDCRAGANQRGIEYDGNYSTFYTPRSLVDKEYVDTLAHGLHPKQAVQAATTIISGNTILSGSTGTIDGIPVSTIISSGNRILIKNQTNGALNGIYSASTGIWGRTSDFDFIPITGEVVQGSYFFVISGTNKSTTWVLTTPDIITSGNTLTFTLFSQITDILAGTGITITVDNSGQHTVSVNGPSLAGNSLLWNSSTCQFDVNPSGGTLAIALSQTITGATNGLTKSGQQIKLGGTLTGSTIISDSRLVKTGIEYGGNYSASFNNCSLVTKEYVLTQMSSGGTYNLQSPAAICVGGICVGTVLTGKTAFQLFEELLVPTLYPAFVAPSESASISPSGTFEIGCNIATLCITGTFNRGTISPAYGTDGFRSGLATCYVFTGCQIANSYACNASSLTKCATNYVVCASQTWTVSTCFSAGCLPKDSKGGNYCSVCGPGQTSAPTATITGIYPYYYGKLTNGSRPAVTNALVTGGTKVLAISTGTIIISFGSCASEYTWFAIPQTSTSKICWYVSGIDNGFMNRGCASDKYPDECQICISSGQLCWSNICYKVYMSGAVGAIISPMEFRNS